jgi:hypothetical protein
MRGVSGAQLHRRVRYGGRKGRSAARRLKAWEKQIARSGMVERMLAEDHRRISALLEPVERFMRGGR